MMSLESHWTWVGRVTPCAPPNGSLKSSATKLRTALGYADGPRGATVPTFAHSRFM